MPDRARLADLAQFARLEIESGDIEPWAAILGALTRQQPWSDEQSLWAVHLYNSTDDLGSAMDIMRVAPLPEDWRRGDLRVRRLASQVALSGERRNLYGGRLLRRLDSYVGLLAGESQRAWLGEAIRATATPQENFLVLMRYLRRVWGVGRLAAFEWAEFVHKVGKLPVETTDGCLWESSGPRESIERLYGGNGWSGRMFSAGWLSDRAAECKEFLANEGAPLSWWDFETVICDFNVMRKGRYYPGKHLAMLGAEIAGLPEPWQPPLIAAYRSVVPQRWWAVPPGADKELGRHYARTGRIAIPQEVG